MVEKKKEKITVTPNGPFLVENLDTMRNSKGEKFEPKPAMTLCRCGQSSTKPCCDGTHLKIDFKDDKDPDRVPDKMDHYKGKEITIHDNRGVCSHAGHCTDNLPSVFRMKKEPWIDPDGAPPEEIARVIKMCPSGALSYLGEMKNTKT